MIRRSLLIRSIWLRPVLWPVPWLVLWLFAAIASQAQDGSSDPDLEGVERIERLERIVAIVDEDPIFASDLERAEEWAGEPKPTRRELLEQLIDERVRAHEVDRFGAIRLREQDVEQQLSSVSADIDRARDEGLVRRQLRVLAYVEERLGALVFVSDDAVRAYYDSTLRDEMLRRGEDLPPFDEVSDAIRTLLREEALERRVLTWTQELRSRAEIIDLLDQPLPLDHLPRVSLTLSPPPDQAANEENLTTIPRENSELDGEKNGNLYLERS